MDIGSLSSAYADYIATENTSSKKLSDAMGSTDYTKATDEEMLDACKQFEAYFLEQVFKEMQKTVDCFKDEDATSNYSNSMLGFFKDQTLQELADTSTKTQGLGLAQTLFEQMKRNYDL